MEDIIALLGGGAPSTVPENDILEEVQERAAAGELTVQTPTTVIAGFSFNDEDIATLPLIALENADEAGFVTKMIDTVKLMFR